MRIQNATMTVYVGPMAASKTTRLIADVMRYGYRDVNVRCFKPSIDSRYSVSDITTHDGRKTSAQTVSTGDDIVSCVASDESIDVVAVDEMFMIPGSAVALIDLYRRGKTIVVSSLDMSAELRPFDEVMTIMPWATSVVKCSAICTTCGEDAHYTKRISNSDIPLSGIKVGGLSDYSPTCLRHHDA